MSFINATLSGVNRLLERLGKRLTESKRKDDASYTVGYSAPYALFVHENLEASHQQEGQAKFLEQPARQMKSQLASTVLTTAKKGVGLKVAMQEAAKQLLAASQELVPVDTGALKASGFVKDDRGNVIAGSDMTPEEALAWRQLLHQQEQSNKQQEQPSKLSE